MRRMTLVVLVVLVAASARAQSHTEKNVVYGMYSGLALLMDVYHPEKPNGYGVIFVAGSGWHASMDYAAVALKDTQIQFGVRRSFRRVIPSSPSIIARLLDFATLLRSKMCSVRYGSFVTTRSGSASIPTVWRAWAVRPERISLASSRCWQPPGWPTTPMLSAVNRRPFRQ